MIIQLVVEPFVAKMLSANLYMESIFMLDWTAYAPIQKIEETRAL